MSDSMSRAEANRRARTIVVKYLEGLGVDPTGRLTVAERQLQRDVADALQKARSGQ